MDTITNKIEVFTDASWNPKNDGIIGWSYCIKITTNKKSVVINKGKGLWFSYKTKLSEVYPILKALEVCERIVNIFPDHKIYFFSDSEHSIAVINNCIKTGYPSTKIAKKFPSFFETIIKKVYNFSNEVYFYHAKRNTLPNQKECDSESRDLFRRAQLIRKSISPFILS